MSINLSSFSGVSSTTSISISSSILSGTLSPASSFAIAGVNDLTTALIMCERNETLCSLFVVRDLKSVSNTGTIFFSSSSSTLMPVDLFGVGSISGTVVSCNIRFISKVANLIIFSRISLFSTCFLFLTNLIISRILDLSILSS